MSSARDEIPPDRGNAVILIPAYNEAEVVGQVVSQVRACSQLPVIVIDDCSSDSTAEVARTAGATVLSLPAQLGAWGATQTGLRYALRQGHDIAIAMDADGQHEAGSLPELLRPVLEGSADVSIGACTKRGSPLRQVAWVMMKKVSGLALEDITSGYRVYNRQAMRVLAGWRATLLDYQDIGVLLLLQARGLRIVDVQVTMRDRQAGQSRVFHSWLMVAFYMAQTMLLGLTKRRFSRTQRIRGV